ncbi:unnamed protein product [Bursaphelenchus okinawaensis]|uniref:Uncharacterized protein n=1 Tax=Bursaphelenchus okinawaensis TaxID=465554 RepID=A0A811LMU2_9BILA|nr:unnamed protein product [Bursaphelenchus okinawaensis]CAG9124543.1 unnamed protein product [Bursaphelenchus okinawaensis]
MGDNNLLESYNPLYDVHLRQYFASPHMQKHLRNLGLLDSNGVPVQGANNVEGQLYARHQVMMDMMLRNKERVLMQLADLQKKLDAAEKVEIYRRIRSGITNADEFRRQHLTTRSFSRPARARSRPPETERPSRQRRHSGSFDDSDLLKRIENNYEEAQKEYEHDSGKGLYGRLAANAYKYQYLHKLDDRTLINYKDMLQRQLQKLERFREVSFGPHSVAKHQPQLQTSWFFRRRNSKSGTRARTGKSLSPGRASRLPATSASAQPVTKRPPAPKQPPKKLPPLPKKKASQPKANGTAQNGHKLPPTAVIRPSKKEPERSASGASVEKPDKLPSISPTPVAIGAGAAAVGVAALSALQPRPEESDGEYSRPETEASGHLPVSQESDGPSPQPQSDVEPEEQDNGHEAQDDSNEAQGYGHEANVEPSTPQAERKFDMDNHVDNHDLTQEQVEQYENHTEVAPEAHEDHDLTQEHVEQLADEPSHQEYEEPHQYEEAYNQEPKHDDLQEEESVHSEKTHEAPSEPQSHREEVVSVTSSRLESARELLERVRGSDSPAQSPKPDEARGESQMSKDSIDGHIDRVESTHLEAEPEAHHEYEESHYEAEQPHEESEAHHDEASETAETNRSYDEVQVQQAPEVESHDYNEAAHDEPSESHNDSVNAHDHISESQIEPDLVSASESFRQAEEQVQHDVEEEEHARDKRSVEEPSEDMQSSVYQQEEASEPQFQDEYQPTEHHEEQRHEEVHHEEEHQQHEDEPSQEEQHQTRHRDSFTESESEPNLHYQTESFHTEADNTSQVATSEVEQAPPQSADSFHESSVPTIEGESLRDSDDDTRPSSQTREQSHDVYSVQTEEGHHELPRDHEVQNLHEEAQGYEDSQISHEDVHDEHENIVDHEDVERKPSYESMTIQRDSEPQAQVEDFSSYQPENYDEEVHDNVHDIEEPIQKVEHHDLESSQSEATHEADNGHYDDEAAHQQHDTDYKHHEAPENHKSHDDVSPRSEDRHDQGPSTPDSPTAHDVVPDTPAHEDEHVVDNADEESFERRYSQPLTDITNESHGQVHNHSLLSQPSIEITPASEYGGFSEHLDRSARTPVSPVGQAESITEETEEVHEPEESHESAYEQHESHKQHEVADAPEAAHEHEEYHLPDSPDPNAHNDVIPEQHQEHGEITVPEDDEVSPRDHVPEYHPETHEYDAGHEHEYENPHEAELDNVEQGHDSTQEVSHEPATEDSSHEATHDSGFTQERPKSRDEYRDNDHQVEHFQSTEQDFHDALSHEYDQAPIQSSTPEVHDQEYDDSEGHHVIHEEHHVQDSPVHIETESLDITHEQHIDASPRSEFSGSQADSEALTGRTENVSPSDLAVEHEDVLASPRQEEQNDEVQHDSEYQPEAQHDAEGHDDYDNKQDLHTYDNSEAQQNEPEVYHDEFTDEQGHHVVHEEHHVEEVSPGVQVKSYHYEQTTEHTGDDGGVTKRSEYSERSVTDEHPNLMEQSVYEGHEQDNNGNNYDQDDSYGHDNHGQGYENHEDHSSVHEQAHEHDIYAGQSQGSQEKLHPVQLHHEPEHQIVSEDYVVDQQHHDQLPENLADNIDLTHEQKIHEYSYVDDSQPGHHVEEHHYTITSDAEPNKNIEVEDYQEEINDANGTHVVKHFQSTTTIVNENGNGKPYSNGHDDDGINEKTSLLGRDDSDDGDTDSVIIRSSPETTDRTDRTDQTEQETGRAEI